MWKAASKTDNLLVRLSRGMRLPDAVEHLPKRTEWRWERIGWALIALIVVAELFGVFGGGAIAGTTVEEERGPARYAVDYEKWNRYAAVSQAYVIVFAPDATGDTLNVTWTDEIVRGWTIRSSHPDPDSGAATPEGGTFGYMVPSWSKTLVVGFEHLPVRPGYWSGAVTIQAGESEPVTLVVDQRIFP